MEGAGWLSSSFQPPAKTEMVDEAAYPKVGRQLRAADHREPAIGSKVGAARRCSTRPHACGSACILPSRLPPPNPLQPAPKPRHLAAVGPAMAGIRSDADLSAFLSDHKGRKGAGAAVIEFATAWCTKCHEMFPAFYRLSKKVRRTAAGCECALAWRQLLRFAAAAVCSCTAPALHLL